MMTNLHDLKDFFAHLSLTSYETLYTCRGEVDWLAVEDGLRSDIFDVR